MSLAGASGRLIGVARKDARGESASQQSHLRPFRERGAMLERVVSRSFDGVENREAAAAEHFEVHAQEWFDGLGQREPRAETERACARSDDFISATYRASNFPRRDIGFGQTVFRQGIQRDIEAALFEVARNVLPEIRQLQRGASVIGELLPRFVAIVAEIKNEAADGIRRVHAIVEQRNPKSG